MFEVLTGEDIGYLGGAPRASYAGTPPAAAPPAAAAATATDGDKS